MFNKCICCPVQPQYTISFLGNLFRAVPGKKVLGGGVERNLKMGVPPTQFFSYFYGTVNMDIPGNTHHPPNFN